MADNENFSLKGRMGENWQPSKLARAMLLDIRGVDTQKVEALLVAGAEALGALDREAASIALRLEVLVRESEAMAQRIIAFVAQSGEKLGVPSDAIGGLVEREIKREREVFCALCREPLEIVDGTCAHCGVGENG